MQFHPLDPPLQFASRRSPVLGLRGMLATSQPLAVAAGLEILSQGGNAADAAVATAGALNVTEPTSTGIGGDCFALYYDAATRRVSALNGSGRAPAALSLERLQSEGFTETLPPFHPYTITVPGAWIAFIGDTAYISNFDTPRRDNLAADGTTARDGIGASSAQIGP